MLLNSVRSLRIAACAIALAACATDGVISPDHGPRPSADFGPVSASGGVVISQVYGGGGNSGATLKNDFIELYNSGPATVSLAGWSVQYASAAGTTWQTTALTGSIPSGHYFLIQEAQGSGGTTYLPTPDVTGTIAMSATSAKVALVISTTALTGSCPVGGSIVDFVGFGTANCFEGTGAVSALTNTTAAIRLNGGSQDTNNNNSDFSTGAPSPHNTGNAPPANGTPATVVVSPATWSFRGGQTKTFTATAKDADNVVVSTTFTWSSSNPAAATIDAATGIATAVAPGTTTITATSSNSITGTAAVTVTAGNVSVQPLAGPLPVGFQSQVFVSSGSTDGSGNPVTSSNVTWSTNNPGVVAVSPNTGVVTALSVGSATITATAKSDGTSSGSTTVTAYTASVSPTARVGHNTELGAPTDADPSNDVIIARRQYTISYNVSHGGPNWVSWNLDASHTGSSSRCNCFTADTALTRLGYPAYDTNDWINGGQYSRGHMSPSADWADADGDNAPTFFLSNMLPQNQIMNAGAWGSLENYLRTRTTGTNEIYIVSGPIFTKNRSGAGVDGLGFMNSIGHIAVPDSIWKIAVIVPDTRSADQMTSTANVEVIAVNMPNDASASGTWNPYVTTVNAIQKSTGYNFFSMLPDSVAKIVKANDHPPVTTVSSFTSSVSVGQPAAVAGTFTDPDGRGDAPWSMTWDWGDGSNTRLNLLAYPNGTTQYSRSHSYAAGGTYTVRLTVADKYGASSHSDVTITVNP